MNCEKAEGDNAGVQAGEGGKEGRKRGVMVSRVAECQDTNGKKRREKEDGN